MPAQLVALTEGPNILLDKPILLLGRHQECDIQLGSRKVSRRHCCLAQVNGHFVVRDLGSTNGIRINGVKVMEGDLRPGDELTIGNQRYQLDWASKAGEAPAQPKAAPDLRNAIKPAAPPSEIDVNLASCDMPVALPEPGIAAEVPIAVIPPGSLSSPHYDDSHLPPGKK